MSTTDDAPEDDEHALVHRLGELEDEIAVVDDLARAAREKGAGPDRAARYAADLERLRTERSAVLARLGERGLSHRLRAHDDHRRRLRRALEAYNAAAAAMNDALREAQALASIEVLLPGDRPPGGASIPPPPCDLGALRRLAPARPIPLEPEPKG